MELLTRLDEGALPFGLWTPPERAFPHAGWRRARAAALAAMAEGRIAAVIGPAGSGKTLLLRELERTLRAGGIAALRSESGHLDAPRAAAGARDAVLLVDEADALDEEGLRRLLAAGGPAALAALPPFAARLEAPGLPQVVRVPLAPLGPEELRAFVASSLAGAGRDPSLFGEAALDALASRSQGLPRLVKTLGQAAMFHAGMEGSPRVEARHVEAAQAMLRPGEAAAGPASAPRPGPSPAPDPVPASARPTPDPGPASAAPAPPPAEPPAAPRRATAGTAPEPEPAIRASPRARLSAGTAFARLYPDARPCPDGPASAAKPVGPRPGWRPSRRQAFAAALAVAMPLLGAVAVWAVFARPPPPPSEAPALAQGPERRPDDLRAEERPAAPTATEAPRPAGPPETASAPPETTAPAPAASRGGGIAAPPPARAVAPPPLAAPARAPARYRGENFNETLGRGGTLALTLRPAPGGEDGVAVRFESGGGLIGNGELSGRLSPDGRLVASGTLMMGRNPFFTELEASVAEGRLSGTARYTRLLDGGGRGAATRSRFRLLRE